MHIGLSSLIGVEQFLVQFVQECILAFYLPTGLANTNYEGKAAAAIQALKDGDDFVYVHVEASDEAGHDGDEVTGKSEELELTDSIVHDTLVLADGKLTRYDRRVMRYRKHWDLLIPTSGIIQTCGNMGIISLGIGWEYGKRRQWETQLLFGYIPKFSSDDEKLTMTLKENFIPWRRNIGKGCQLRHIRRIILFSGDKDRKIFRSGKLFYG